MFNLTKSFRFESAHRLAKGYTGKCKNIHGHSWNGEVSVDCEQLDRFNFGVDYKDLGAFTKEIENLLDHKILLWKEDSSLVSFCSENGYEIVLFKDNPTCEVIAKWIHGELVKYCVENIPFAKNIKVSIKETCTTSCTYHTIH